MEYRHSLSHLIGRQLNQTMLHTLTLLTVMRLLSQGKSSQTPDQSILAFEICHSHLAQLNCHQGQGFISYERIPNHRLEGLPETSLVRDVLDPAEMVEKCMEFCQGQNSNNSVSCGFFNLQVSKKNVNEFLISLSSYHQSGKSRSRLNFGPAEKHRWHESQCHFALLGQVDSSEKMEPPPPVQLQPDEKFDHFAQICLSPGWKALGVQGVPTSFR